MQNEKRRPSWYTAIVAVICIILTVVLISNVIIIVKGTLNPERPPSVFGVTSMIVLTGSMSGDAPDHIEAGDMIVTKAVDPTTLKVGDVITYMENGKTTVTHRIIGINEDGTFKTKGDANNTEDDTPVKHEDVIGIYAFRIPKLGDVAMFAQTPVGMIIFIGVPLVLYAILDALIRGKQNKKRKKAEAASKDEADKLKEELEKLKAQLGEKEE
jgi:signal peptidase